MAAAPAVTGFHSVARGASGASSTLIKPLSRSPAGGSHSVLWGSGTASLLPSLSLRKTVVTGNRLYISAARKAQVAAEKAPPAKPKSKEEAFVAALAADKNLPVIERTDDPMGWREYRPKMDGDEPDIWEGSTWNFLGFFLEYLWAFGILVALVASVYAVRTYNVGAVDFKDTELYKASQEGGPFIAPEGLDNSLLDDAPPL